MSKVTPQSLYSQANLLALITIGYNIIEGVISVWFGASDETLALFGFGLDSFVEVISGIGIWHMIRRIRQHGEGALDDAERQALRITGWAFNLLAAGLALSAGLSLYQHHKPESTVWGLIISLVSMSFMWFLIRHKTRVGQALNSPAILADAACSRICLLLSLVLLVASAGCQWTGVGGFDALGALAIAYFSFREGKEAFLKAKGVACSCGGACS